MKGFTGLSVKAAWSKLAGTVAFTAVTAGLSIVGSVGTYSPVAAQVMSPQTMLDAMGASCDRATEVTYRSQQLVSPDGNTQVYVEGLLRKMVNPYSNLRDVDTDDYCYPDVRETIRRQLVIETRTDVRRLVDAPYDEGYILYQPRAFSSDSRFLALDMRVAYTDGELGSYVLFFDIENDALVQVPNVCEGLAFENYAGFTSPTEAVVFCQRGNSRLISTSGRFEAVDLLTGNTRPLTDRPEGLSGHGQVLSAFEVTKVQMFE